MYSGLPTGHRRAVKTALAASWLASCFAGLSAVILAPGVYVHELGAWGTLLSGMSLATATIVAASGVAFGRYRWEWVAAWVSAASLAPYVATVWALILTTAASNTTQAWLASSLLGFYITRAFLCAAHAAKLREAHVAAAVVLNSMTDDEGENDGDGRAGGE